MRRSRLTVSSLVIFNIQAVAVINLSIYLLAMLLHLHRESDVFTAAYQWCAVRGAG